MTWAWIAAAVVVAALTAAATPAVLRRLPEPDDDPGKKPYRELDTRAFRAWVFVTALAAGVIAVACVPPVTLPAWLSLTTVGALLGCIDAATTYLPRVLSWAGWALTGAGLITSALVAHDWGRAWSGAMGAALAGALFAALWWVSRGGLAFGDVRAAVMVGGTAGATSLTLVSWSLVLGALTSVLVGLAVAARRRQDGPFPYGPGLLAGPYLAVLANTLLGQPF